MDSNNGFQKGHPRYGGRTKGTANKRTQENVQRIASFLNAHWDEFQTEIWEQLTPKDKKDTMVAMLNYVYPKLQSVDMTNLIKTQDSAIDKLRELVNDDDIV